MFTLVSQFSLSWHLFLEKKNNSKLKKKKEGNKHPLKSPFGSKGGKNNQADVSCGPATQQPPSSGQESPRAPRCLYFEFFPTSCQEKLLRGNLPQPKAAFPSLWTPSCSPAIPLAKTKSSLHVPMTLSHLQHSQPCSHLLAPRHCLAGTSLTALFEEPIPLQFAEA